MTTQSKSVKQTYCDSSLKIISWLMRKILHYLAIANPHFAADPGFFGPCTINVLVPLKLQG